MTWVLSSCELGLVDRGGKAWATSQTRLARLVLLLACCPHWGDMGALGLLTIDGIGKLIGEVLILECVKERLCLIICILSMMIQGYP